MSRFRPMSSNLGHSRVYCALRAFSMLFDCGRLRLFPRCQTARPIDNTTIHEIRCSAAYCRRSNHPKYPTWLDESPFQKKIEANTSTPSEHTSPSRLRFSGDEERRSKPTL